MRISSAYYARMTFSETTLDEALHTLGELLQTRGHRFEQFDETLHHITTTPPNRSTDPCTD